MKIDAIRDALPGEHAVAVVPAIAPLIANTWRRRLNFYTGRSLSATALSNEQQHRAGRLATYGQTVSPGVVSGLEALLEAAPTAAEAHLLITAGLGITAFGEDVQLPVNRRLRLQDIPMYAPVAQPDAEPLPAGSLQPRALGRSLQGRLARNEANLPPVAIVVLQPITAEIRGEFDPTDPCEEDPRNYAFEDWQWVDGCRVVLYSWPSEWLPLPESGDLSRPENRDRWRNRLAYAIFNRESELRGNRMPWELLGVPLALIGFNADWQPLFADGYAVVRLGGHAKSRSQATQLPVVQNPFLWQARVQQFAEQLTEMDPIATVEAGALRRQGFRYLPPVGLLPKAMLDYDSRRLPFFPSTYDVRLRPIPLEQLEMVMQATAALSPYDLTQPDQVQVLLPVPQVLYEPNLLQTEVINPEFASVLARFVTQRSQTLQRRQDLRQKAQALHRAITGRSLDFPNPDPDALDSPEAIATAALDPPEENYDTELHQGTRRVISLQALRERLPDFLRDEANQKLDETHSEFVGLEPFILDLEDKVKRANDPIDFAFLRVRTDIYRIRQFMLGEEAAGRLATSPALAEIVRDEKSAFLTQQRLATFFEQLRQAQPQAPMGTPVSTDGPMPAVSLAIAPMTAIAPSLLSYELTNFGLTQNPVGLAQNTAAFNVVGTPTVSSRITQAATSSSVSSPLAASVSLAQASNLINATQLFATPRVNLQPAVVEQAPRLELIDRNVTVGERLTPPAATTSLNLAVDGQLQTVGSLAQLAQESQINLSGIEIAGTRSSSGTSGITFGRGDTVLQSAQAAVDRLVQQKAQEGAAARDDAQLFEAGIKALDDTVTTLRRAEQRVQDYRLAIADCRRTLQQIQAFLGQVDQRLKTVGDELAEARHDVSVARALQDEEQARINAINERRQDVIRNQVPFLVFHRPRLLNPSVPLPSRSLDPAVVDPAVPLCLRSHPDVPSELRQAINLLRDAPMKWFVHLPPLLQRLDRPDLLIQTVQHAKVQAQLQPVQPIQALLVSATTVNTVNVTRLGQAISRTMMAQQQVVQRSRQQVAQLNLGQLVDLSWSQSRDRAQDLLSLGDLIDGRHQRSEVTQRATQELNTIAQVAGCLYAAFGDVLPQIRLLWAERLSQYDDPIELRVLADLPQWDRIPYRDRRQMQELTDWLYARMAAQYQDAIALIHDLVRICILLASHAPVNQMIAGRVTQPTTVKPAGRIDLTIDPAKVRVGMPVLLYGANNQVVAEAQVNDLKLNQAVAQITRTYQPQVQLPENARVQFLTTRLF